MPTSSSSYPAAYHKEKADEIWAKLSAKAEETGALLPDRQLHDALAGNSPFLANIIENLPENTLSYLTGDAADHIEQIVSELRAPRPAKETTDELMIFLRKQKAHVSLVTALADVGGKWPLEAVTKALSDFADACLEVALAHLLHKRMQAGELPWPEGKEQPASPALSAKCGYFILGMGKLGAHELNYSSDIDLIILYDAAATSYTGRKSLSHCFVKLTQELVQIMDKRTMHGYVFRTDLRLRPDPGATPVAIAVEAAESYYHSMAVNWERSAMIKARVIAGDQNAGAIFLKNMASWVWRRSMDFVALKDIAAIKNQINRHYDQRDAVAPGYNVKLGVGGIREIEFFTQINQLLHAGRHPELRLRSTKKALAVLKNLNIIDAESFNKLTDAYNFLRILEHRLQMVDDAQTHELPKSEDDMKRIAGFTGFATPDALLNEIVKHSMNVSSLYGQLMPEESADTQPEYSENRLPGTLAEFGFDNPDASTSLIEGWRRGRYRALRTEKAKNILEKCLPLLLSAFSKTHAPSAALLRFDKFLSQLPAGVQLFSLLQANPSLFKLLGRIMGLAPALAEQLSKKPDLWDMLLDPAFFAPIEDNTFLEEQLNNLLLSAQDFQDILDTTRRFVAEQKFRSGIHLMEGLAGVEETGNALTRIADVTLQALVLAVETDFAQKHGYFSDGGIAVLAMGKYGGKELTHTSDLDIVFLYHCEDMKAMSDGDKPLAPSQYFSRLGQHIITAITALTPEGRLFEVDTRLRPSGSQGPLVVTLKTFTEYYATSAWTWEHMALTRARIIIAPDRMVEPLHDTITGVLTTKRDKDELLAAVADMRTKLFSEFGSNNLWAIKHCRGGLVDMEFICQYLMLRDGHRYPQLFEPELMKAIEKLREIKALDEEESALLSEAHDLLQKVQSLLRLCIGPAPADSSEIPEGLRQILVETTKLASFKDVEDQVRSYQDKIYKLYQKLIEEPANTLDKNQE